MGQSGTDFTSLGNTPQISGTQRKEREKRERETQGVITLPLQFRLWIWTLLSETQPRCPFAFCVLSVASWEQRAWLKCRCVAEPLRLRRERGSERWREGGRDAESASAANGISNGRGLLLLRSIEKAILCHAHGKSHLPAFILLSLGLSTGAQAGASIRSAEPERFQGAAR